MVLTSICLGQVIRIKQFRRDSIISPIQLPTVVMATGSVHRHCRALQSQHSVYLSLKVAPFTRLMASNRSIVLRNSRPMNDRRQRRRDPNISRWRPILSVCLLSDRFCCMRMCKIRFSNRPGHLLLCLFRLFMLKHISLVPSSILAFLLSRDCCE